MLPKDNIYFEPIKTSKSDLKEGIKKSPIKEKENENGTSKSSVCEREYPEDINTFKRNKKLWEDISHGKDAGNNNITALIRKQTAPDLVRDLPPGAPLMPRNHPEALTEELTSAERFVLQNISTLKKNERYFVAAKGDDNGKSFAASPSSSMRSNVSKIESETPASELLGSIGISEGDSSLSNKK